MRDTRYGIMTLTTMQMVWLYLSQKQSKSRFKRKTKVAWLRENNVLKKLKIIIEIVLRDMCI